MVQNGNRRFSQSTNGSDQSTSGSDSSDDLKKKKRKTKKVVPDIEHFHDEFHAATKHLHHNGCLHKTARLMARNSFIWFVVAFSIAGFLSALGISKDAINLSGNFNGWWSRGTLISNRCAQIDLVNVNRSDLFFDKTGEAWNTLTMYVQDEQKRTLVRRKRRRRHLLVDEHPQLVRQGWAGRELLSDGVLAQQELMVSPFPQVMEDDVLLDEYDHFEAERKREDVQQRVRDLQLVLPEGCVIPGIPPDFVIPEDFEIPEGVEIPPGCEGLLPTVNPTSPPSVTPTLAPTRAPAVAVEEETETNVTSAPVAPTNVPTVAPTPNLTDAPTPSPTPQPTNSEFPPCDSSEPYTNGALFSEPTVWPVWRTRDQIQGNFLEGSTLQSLCEQEEITQKFLHANNLCRKCGDGSECYQPWSLVFFARLAHPFGMFFNCSELGNAWDSIKDEVVPTLVECARDINVEYSQRLDGAELPDSCPPGFFTHMIDNEFHRTGTSVYTSTIFVSDSGKLDPQFELVNGYGQGDENIEAAYDTQFQTFVERQQNIQLYRDMVLAFFSGFVTSAAMIVHTKSLFLAHFGLMQIVMSFPIAFLFYNTGFDFFPFLNYAGLFIVFALGADDVFVAVDKWKNTRMEHPDASTEDIAAMALPDAAEAMFLTTSTTAAAFLATAGSPIAPLKSFSVFLGLLVIFDYLLCLTLVFPAICIYDKLLRRDPGPNAKYYMWYISFVRMSELEDTEVKPESLIRRILRNYHKRLHLIREPVFILCFAVVLISFVQASRIDRPSASSIRLFEPDDNQFEQRFQWNENILLRDIFVSEVSTVNIVWGLTPADTGDYKNPEIGTQLVLENTFDLSQPAGQVYLRDFCDRLYEQEFAGPIDDEFVCPMRRFDNWLQQQFSGFSKSQAYLDHCGNTQQLPVPSEIFDDCIYAWSQLVGDRNVLVRTNPETSNSIFSNATTRKLAILIIPFAGRARPTSGFSILDGEFHLIQDWLDGEIANAPPEVSRPFFGNNVYWWYDTNRVLLDTALVACGIAMAATGIVIFFSSRSFVLTLFAIGTVGYVIISVAAMLISLGWTIGFLESILFSILIGLSCDFVVHLCHAYTQFTGYAPRSERTLFALIAMGPSILAAAFTTISAAFFMLFAVITFFSKFATILLFAMLQACFGTFVVFIALVDFIGPCNPSQTVDEWLNGLFGFFGGEYKPADGMPYDPNLEVLRGKNPEWPVVTAYEDEE